ncbi:PDDEXK nuclease domain-containing protein [Niabella yanshanensis]|uniref:PDDEXK nuclease domain-containing protein n=1 Tax=Niabella yanshanensis TaxID=577386 RepID=A0ABZ0VZ67_9BACT|nr:PDDEXK nuclease domain-containing protein [Niabella yanshanensis]WQD36323.1 PDDEXK nuclease domain-containing protein [Niabella yanshanensis]
MNNFAQLIKAVSFTHRQLQSKAAGAVNQALTIRNYLIGYYIVEFEQNGKGRAAYGKSLLDKMAAKLDIRGLTAPELSRCRQFYLVYPQILGTLSQESHLLPANIFGTLSQKSKKAAPAKSVTVTAAKIVSNLSFSHIAELIKIEDPLKRSFYEVEAIKGIWGVRELKRQINSLYFERSSLSSKPQKLATAIRKKVTPQEPSDIVKNIYAFEFLGLPAKDIVEESDLEAALLDNLQGFILEMGNGFCLEGRQRKILIGQKHYFVDLVFYHRILKCHVLLELKIGEFEHGDISQLNTYLNFFKGEVCESTDNPPVGILLVAEKDQALVEYATAGMDKHLFVKKYMLRLPQKGKLKKYVEKEIQRLK